MRDRTDTNDIGRLRLFVGQIGEISKNYRWNLGKFSVSLKIQVQNAHSCPNESLFGLLVPSPRGSAAAINLWEASTWKIVGGTFVGMWTAGIRIELATFASQVSERELSRFGIVALRT